MLQVGQIIQLPEGLNGQLHSYRVEDIRLGRLLQDNNGRQLQLYLVTLNNGQTYEYDGTGHLVINHGASSTAYPIFVNGRPIWSQ